MRKNLLIAQSGGPTAAINATLAGVVERALTSSEVGGIYGARFGIKRVLKDDIVDLGEPLTDPKQLGHLMHTPAAALGSCRMKLPAPGEAPDLYDAIFKTFAKWNIGYFVYIGGNDSMDTVQKLSACAEDRNCGVRIMGAPKTIDNDLCGMDHSPGFGSAAKYIATTFSELWCDCRVYDVPAVTIVEVMGRHVGWLTASSALARVTGDAPHLIYLPEIPFEEERFLADVRGQLEKNDAVIVAVSEGVRRPDGSFVGEEGQNGVTDVFGHKYLSGAGQVLESLVREKVGCKARSIDLSLMQRCSAHLASSVDLREARLLGGTALDRALAGGTGQMSVLRRLSNSPYSVEYDTIPVEEAANLEKFVPREWINEEGNFVTLDMMQYLVPLIDGSFGSETRRGMPVHFFAPKAHRQDSEA